MMSSAWPHLWGFTAANALHLLGILLLALILTLLLGRATKLLVRPAGAQTRAAQQREQQTRDLARLIHSLGSKLIWAIAILTALPEFGISALPGVTLAAAVMLVLAFGAQGVVRDVVSGLCIVLEDQYLPGDTIQSGEVTGRVEQLTLRRTLVRDTRGALVSIANADLRKAANLSRDWSQGFVDVPVAAETPLEKALQALELASAELRGDAAWSQALLDGPRILGVQGYERGASTLRLQVRTAPTRQDEVCRELRRRIQLEFQRRGISASSQQSGAPVAVETPLT